MMNKAKEIVSGYTNLVKSSLNLTTEQEEELFNARTEICNVCENSVDNICKLCGCVLAAKTKSLYSSCPDNPKKW